MRPTDPPTDLSSSSAATPMLLLQQQQQQWAVAAQRRRLRLQLPPYPYPLASTDHSRQRNWTTRRCLPAPCCCLCGIISLDRFRWIQGGPVNPIIDAQGWEGRRAARRSHQRCRLRQLRATRQSSSIEYRSIGFNNSAARPCHPAANTPHSIDRSIDRLIDRVGSIDQASSVGCCQQRTNGHTSQQVRYPYPQPTHTNKQNPPHTR